MQHLGIAARFRLRGDRAVINLDVYAALVDPAARVSHYEYLPCGCPACGFRFFGGLMVPDGTSTGCACHTVLPRDVSSNATDHRTFCTARRLSVACNNETHSHQPA